MKRLWLTVAFVLHAGSAMAQSNPPSPGGAWPFNFVPTQGQWAAAWQGKMDYTGSPACTQLGCTLQGKINLLPSTTSGAGLNCGQGTAPTTPTNGDFWCTTAGVFAYINGSPVTLGGAAGIWTVPQGGTGQTSFTANRPLIGNGAGALAQGTVTSTNGSTLFATAQGTPGNGNCASWNNGNVVDAGVGACGGTGGAGTVTASPQNQIAYYSSAGTVATVSGLTTCNSGYIATSAGGVPSCQTALAAALQGGITTVGTIGTGTWQGTVVGPTYGGTGISNGSFTSTLGGNFVTSGAAVTLTAVGATNVTLPTSGNIPNSNGTSGGIPYYNTSTTITSSGVLTANLPVLGGGAGNPPVVGSVTSTNVQTKLVTATSGFTTPSASNCAAFDANGNIKDSGIACGSANATPVLLCTITGTGLGDLHDVGGTVSGSPANCNASYPNGSLASGYTSYTIVFYNLRASSYAGGLTYCHLQVYEGGSYQATSYVSFTNSTMNVANTATSEIFCSNPRDMGSGIVAGLSGSITFYPNGSTGTAAWGGSSYVYGTGNSSFAVSNYGGTWNSTGSITGFRVFMNGASGIGAVNITGTVKVYGNP